MDLDSVLSSWKEEQEKIVSDLQNKLNQILLKTMKEKESLEVKLKQTESQYQNKLQSLNQELVQTKEALEKSRREASNETEKLMKAQDEALDFCKKQSAKQIEELTEELKKTKQTLSDVKTESSQEIKILKAQLGIPENLKEKLQDESQAAPNIEILQRELEWTKQALEQTTQDRNTTRAELRRYQLEMTKELRATKEAMMPQKKEIQNPAQGLSSADLKVVEDEDISVIAVTEVQTATPR